MLHGSGRETKKRTLPLQNPLKILFKNLLLKSRIFFFSKILKVYLFIYFIFYFYIFLKHFQKWKVISMTYLKKKKTMFQTDYNHIKLTKVQPTSNRECNGITKLVDRAYFVQRRHDMGQVLEHHDLFFLYKCSGR